MVILIGFLSTVLILIFPVMVAAQAVDPGGFFEMRIRPVLANNCFSCHTNSKLGGLELDTREHLLKGGKSGPAVVPGKPEESLLIRAVRQEDERLKMPLGGKLKEQEIAVLAAWVRMGAPWPESAKSAQPAAKGKEFTLTAEQKAFWSFQPLQKPALPEVKDQDWIRSPLDRFVLSRLETRGLEPVRAADKRTLIRRASLDLTGLPPTPEEVEAFLKDSSPEAFARVVDRLLASPHYGERWGRYWLDVARYGEDDVRSDTAVPYANGWRYRDWVIRAFNQDMPYDLFIKAQIAGDLMHERHPEKLTAGTGFFGLGPWYYDIAQPPQARADERNDRIDTLTRGFLGLTVACARCHDHKYDPISMKDYYALAGVFASSEYEEYPLVSDDVVNEFKRQGRKIRTQESAIQDFLQTESNQLAEILARKTSRYLLAAWKVLGSPKLEVAKLAEEEKLDRETLQRWVKYLRNPQKEHPYLKTWNELLTRGGNADEAKRVADEFQEAVLAVLAEKKEADEENEVLLAQAKPKKNSEERLLPNAFVTYYDYCSQCGITLKSIAREKFVLWNDLFAGKPDKNDLAGKDVGVFCFNGEQLEPFLSGEWKNHLESMRAELDSLRKALPPQYPYLHGLKDSSYPANLKLHLRGSPFNLGQEVPRKFLAVLSQEESVPFSKGSGRLELSEAIASHPLAARVMVNRIWKYHFGRGIVGTPSNFGQLGERPSHPELLEYLASRFKENNYSIKALHREIMLSATYQLSSDFAERNFAADPDNRLLWRANRRRLDVEALRDSLLFVSGGLDSMIGGSSVELNDENKRRTVYSKVSRFKINSLLTLFDFPDPSISNEQRNVTNVPLQGLFFMNSSLVLNQAELLANRLCADNNGDNAAKIKKAYRLLYGREATDSEVRLGLEFLGGIGAPSPGNSSAWQQYAQVLLSSNEFIFVN
jgi:cytochrome c553